MPLPKLVTPEFTVMIPSTKEPVKIRPFLVKEEKVLFMALEGQDAKEIENAILNVLEACIITPGINLQKLPSYDIEYLFLQLRGKSVGEEITMLMRHMDNTDCKHVTEVKFNVDEINVKFNENHIDKIEIGNGIGIKFKDPSLSELVNGTINITDDEYDMVTGVVANCIGMIWDADNVYDDFTIDEAKEFLGEMTQEQFVKLQTFFDTMPKLSKNIEWNCTACGKSDSIVVEGLQNFFT